MNDGISDDDADAQRRAKRAEKARKSRADARRAREEAWRHAQKEPSNVTVVTLRPPPGVTLERHFQIVSDLVQRIVADETLDLIDRGRIAIAAIVPMSRCVEVSEFRERLESLERRAGLSVVR